MKAVYYLRTSSASNLEGDSETRQKEAIFAYAEKNSLEIVQGAYDQAIAGTDHVMSRNGIKELTKYCEEHGVSIILCENASRFARDLIIQEMGFQELKAKNLQIIPVDAPDYFTGDTPSLNLIRQILGSVSEFEKSNLVHKLRGARERIRLKKGKCEGRRSLQEIYGAKKYRNALNKIKNLVAEGFTYAKVAGILAEQGFVQPTKGKPFHKSQIMRLIQKEEEYG